MASFISKENMPNDLLTNLESAAIDVGTNFLSGELTTCFAPVNAMADSVIGTASTVLSAVDPETLIQITQQLTDYVVDMTVKELTAYTTDRLASLIDVSGLPNMLLERTTYWTQEKLLTAEDILAMIQTTNVQDEIDADNEELKTSKIAEIMADIARVQSIVKEKTEMVVAYVQDGCNMVTSYITQGPDWIITQLNTYVGKYVDIAESYIGGVTDTALNYRDFGIDWLGNQIGTATADVINKIAIAAAKKYKADAEQLIAEVQVQTMNAITKAIMVVREFTGIAIPPVYPPLPKLTSLF